MRNSHRLAVLAREMSIVCALLLGACGGGGGGSNTPESAAPAPATRSGSLVYRDLEQIVVMNASTLAERRFAALDFAVSDAVSVSRDGVIAQLADRDRDQAVIRLTQLDGTAIQQFVYNEPLSFSVSGAVISPNGLHVAFAFNTFIDETNARGDRTVVCETRVTDTPLCIYHNFLRDPAWTPDNKLVGVEAGKQLYVANQTPNYANPPSNLLGAVGPGNLDRAEAPAVSPDGKTIVYSTAAGSGQVYGLDLASGRVTPLTSDGLGQFHPHVTPDGAFLLYRAQCCQTTPGAGGATATGPRLHAITFRPGVTTATPYAVNFLTDALGKSIGVGRNYGVTPKTL